MYKYLWNKVVFSGLLLCFAVAIIAVGATPQQLAKAQDNGVLSSPEIDALIAKAKAEGFVRVIVGTKTQPVNDFKSSKAQAQMADIAKTQGQLKAELRSYNARIRAEFKYIPYVSLEVDAAALEQLRRLPNVTSIVENELRTPALAQTTDIIDADETWNMGYTGAGQTVAILDTGVDKSHPHLKQSNGDSKVKEEYCHSRNTAPLSSLCPGEVTTLTRVEGAANPYTPNCLAGLNCPHGTFVAGAIAGNTGVAPGATIIAIQVFSLHTISPTDKRLVAADDDILLGMQDVLELATDPATKDLYKIAAVNMSLGGGAQYLTPCDTSPYKNMIDQLKAQGIATVAASGQSTDPLAGLTAPACVSSAVSVGASNDADEVFSGSNTADYLDLMAPGVNVTTTTMDADDTPYGSSATGLFEEVTGTSLAAPHVAGAYALIKSAVSLPPATAVGDILTALQTKTVVDITDTGPDPDITTPRIDIDNALTTWDVVGRPTLVDPLNGETVPSAPAYTWTAVAGASAYVLQINDPSGKSIHTQEYGSEICADSCSVTPSLISYIDGKYMWWVRARGTSGYGSWSLPGSFVFDGPISTKPAKPTLVSPIGGITIPDELVPYSWNASDGATDYQLRILKGSTVVYNQWHSAADICPGGTCAVIPNKLLVNGTYKWQVLAGNQYGNSALTSLATFVHACPTCVKPGTPVLGSPVGGSIMTDAPVALSWTAAGVASVTDYQLRILKGTTVIYSQWYRADTSICPGGMCAATPTTLNYANGGTYKWQVMAKNGYGSSAWATALTFKLDCPSPTCVKATAPVLTTPVGGVSVAAPVAYTWAPVTDVTDYQLLIKKGTTTVHLKWYRAADICGEACVVTPGLYSYVATTYKWQVRAANGYQISAWTSQAAFKAVPGPANGFKSTFNGSMTGWVEYSGDWSIKSSALLYTPGIAGYDVTAAFNHIYEDGQYKVILNRRGCAECGFGLVVRGDPATLGPDGSWSDGYLFDISRKGKYAVWKVDGGILTPLQNWTIHSAIKKDNTAYNTLLVKVSGYEMAFYINNKLVWTGSDDTHTSGYFGVEMWRDVSSTGNEIRVNQAEFVAE